MREELPPGTAEPELCDVLADPRRRHVLSLLEEQAQHNRMTLRDLSVQLAEGDEQSPDALAVSLHHRHLPKLDDAGLIRYNPTTKMVVPTLAATQYGLTPPAGDD